MANAPRWKIYDSDGTYRAACKDPEAAAAVVALYGHGSTIRDGHRRVVWTEGADGDAGDSYDEVAIAVAQKRA